MQVEVGRLERLDETAEARASNELVQRIRKLRWMGMEEEAERLQKLLREVHQADILPSSPGDTD